MDLEAQGVINSLSEMTAAINSSTCWEVLSAVAGIVMALAAVVALCLNVKTLQEMRGQLKAEEKSRLYNRDVQLYHLKLDLIKRADGLRVNLGEYCIDMLLDGPIEITEAVQQEGIKSSSKLFTKEYYEEKRWLTMPLRRLYAFKRKKCWKKFISGVQESLSTSIKID